MHEGRQTGLAVRIISGQADQEADAVRRVALLRERSERPNRRTAEDADAFLTRRGLILRRVTAYKLPNALRMSVGSEEANRLAVATLAEFMGRSAAR